MYVITVAPMDYGWSVRAPGLSAGPMLFRTGGQAERAARGLGERIAEAGEEAEVRVFLSDGRLVGQFPYLA